MILFLFSLQEKNAVRKKDVTSLETKEMTVSWLKYGAVLLIIAALCAVMSALAVYFRPHTDTSAVEADYTFSASAFAGELAKSSEEERKQYIGKIIELSGVPKYVKEDSTQQILIFEESEYEISASMEKEKKLSESVLKEGLDIRIKCVCRGIEPGDSMFPGLVQMNRCNISE